ncbi:AEC family transporter [Nocardia sp. CY41]|uniref:AEC family transporter n=1 Tax=Nocardia sp. CY41 TaxID=2608686 RepID=UPI0013578BF4|nr:AEC family transporter [Nocardia sp. CY41]
MTASAAALGQALEPVIPIAVTITAGAWFARRKIIDAATSSRILSEIAFRLAIPAYLFHKLYLTDLRQVFDLRSLSVYAAVALLGAAAIGVWAWRRGIGARGVALRIMASCQVNTAYFAIPVLVLLFGTAAPIFPVLLLQVLVLTVVVLAIMESAPGSDDTETSPLRRILGAVGRSLTTPVVLACVAGVALNAVHCPIPATALESLSFLGEPASFVALLGLGVHLGDNRVRWRDASTDENALVAFKCLAFPLLVWTAMNLAGVPDPWRSYLVLIAAMPAPQNVFIFAQTYDSDIDFAAAAVLKSTVASLCLLPVWQLLVT